MSRFRIKTVFSLIIFLTFVSSEVNCSSWEWFWPKGNIERATKLQFGRNNLMQLVGSGSQDRLMATMSQNGKIIIILPHELTKFNTLMGMKKRSRFAID